MIPVSLTLLSILCFGFLLGMRHAFDADHVVAVSTIVSRKRSIGAAALTAICWGAGHGLTMLGVGGAIVLSGLVIPQRVGLSLELGVALMLIVLGVVNVIGIVREARETLASRGRNHRDGSSSRQLEMRLDESGFYQAVRPMAIGVVHGLAGSAGMTLLLLPIIHDPIWSMAYLVTFGFGTITGMMLTTVIVAAPFLYMQTHRHPLRRWIAASTGVFSTVFGAFLAYQIGFVDGLFTSIIK
jgi:high-affinity nickel-transport protein